MPVKLTPFANRITRRNKSWLACLLVVVLAQLFGDWPRLSAQEPAQIARSAFLIRVPLPLTGNRDEAIQQQINQVSARRRGDDKRPIVILHFTSKDQEQAQSAPAARPTRGSQFERALSLARFLTSPAAAKVRIVAYLTEPVEGHAVLPVLACEEILASPDAELGQAAVDDESIDDTIRGAYRDIVRRRGTVSEAAVAAMLDANVEVIKAEMTDGDARVVTSTEAKELRTAGKILREETIWSGGGLASFHSARMRSLGWLSHVVDNEDALASALNVTGRIQAVKLRPETIEAARIDIDKDLDANLVNQIIRSIDERSKRGNINLLVLNVSNVYAEFSEALRLAQYLARLKDESVATAAIIQQSSSSPALLAAMACDQVITLQSAAIGSSKQKPGLVQRMSTGNIDALLALEKQTGRPASLLTAALDPDCSVQLMGHKQNGRQLPLAQWQLNRLDDADQWVPRENITSGGEIDPQTALRFGLIDSVAADDQAALIELGLTSQPDTIQGPWLETAVQRILARAWLPRLLVVVGFMCLMIEMGSPGLGVGGFAAALCFLGFFWIEGLNGNLEWLEVLLFLAGMVSLAIELFVMPGFGVFGIGGILMVLGSIVLASQTFVFPSNSEQLTIIANNLFWVAICALIVLAGAFAAGKRLENTPVLRWVTIEPAGTDDVAELEQREAIVHWEHLLGQDGLTTTRLNPSGKAQFGRMIVNVLGTNLIDEGVAVRVVEVRGNSVFVEPIE